MTKIKLCGLSRACDIAAANALQPDYIGFVFAEKSPRYVSPEKAVLLRQLLRPEILAVGVFVDTSPETVARLLNTGVIDLAQLHGHEDESYLRALRRLSDKPLIQAFCVRTTDDLSRANASSADQILLDAGAGSGRSFDWTLLRHVTRPYLLAGGLDATNVTAAIRTLHPDAVDVSSGIESNGVKDLLKMSEFVTLVRKEDSHDQSTRTLRHPRRPVHP